MTRTAGQRCHANIVQYSSERLGAGGARPLPLPKLKANGKIKKQHKAFERLVASAGVWEAVKGKGRTTGVPPAWVWEALVAFAPEPATLACQAADLASGARYFEVRASYVTGQVCGEAAMA